MMKSCMTTLCIFLLTLGAMAQIQNGQFSGTVTDASGAAVAGAKVTMTNQGTNLSVTATTNGTGVYEAKELPIGVYKITVEAAGFKTFSNNGVTLDAGSIARVDVKMQLGQAREVIEVTGEASVVNTEEAKLATTIGTAQIENLPLNGRNVYDLMQLAPGAVNVNGVDFEQGHGTVVNGLREDFNGFLINGVANKGLSGGVNNTPIEDTVQEFQQLQLNMSAQYGNSAGSINNLVTKSGTNSLPRQRVGISAQRHVRRQQLLPESAGCVQTAAALQPIWRDFRRCVNQRQVVFLWLVPGGSFYNFGHTPNHYGRVAAWRQAVIAAQPNSVAALLYQNFAPSIPGTQQSTLDQYVPATCDPNDPTCSGDPVPTSVVPVWNS